MLAESDHVPLIERNDRFFGYLYALRPSRAQNGPLPPTRTAHVPDAVLRVPGTRQTRDKSDTDGSLTTMPERGSKTLSRIAEIRARVPRTSPMSGLFGSPCTVLHEHERSRM